MAKGDTVKYFTYTNVFRYFYVQAFGWATLCAFFPEWLLEVLGLPADTVSTPGMSVLCTCLAAIVTTFALGNVAAAQMSEASQRKMLMAGLKGVCVFVGYVLYWKEAQTPFGFQFNFANHCFSLAIGCYCLYVNKASAGKGIWTAPKSRVQKALRLMWAQQVMWALAWNWDAAGTFAMMGGEISGEAGPYFAGLFAACVTLVAFLTICASECCSEEDAIKYGQYAIGANMVWNFVFAWCVADMMLAASLQQAQFQMFLWLFNVMTLIWGLYPASNKTFLFRWFYVNMYMFVVMCTVNPALPWALNPTMTISAEATRMLGSMMCFLMCCNMAFAQLDDDAQHKMLQYWILGYFYFLGLHFSGKIDLGMWLFQMLVELKVVYCLVYPHHFAFLGKLLPGGGSKAMRTSTSPKRRGRSSTPKAKKA